MHNKDFPPYFFTRDWTIFSSLCIAYMIFKCSLDYDRSSSVILNCTICGDRADGYHFGAICCAACGAFFRRSVSDQKVYSCYSKNCNVQYESLKRGGVCRFCRFLKCLQSGMLPYEVRAKRSSCFEYRSPTGVFKQIVIGSHLEMIVQLRREMMSFQNIPFNYGIKATFQTFKTTLDEEFRIFQRLMGLYNGILSLLSSCESSEDFEPNINWYQLDERSQMKDLFLMFFIHECCLATAIYGGLQLDRLILPNMSYIDLSESSLESFYGNERSAKDPACLARLSLSCLNFLVHTMSRSLQAARLDEPETALLFFCSLQQIIPAFKRTNPSQVLFSAILTDISITINTSGYDISTRMGNILLLLTPLVQGFQAFKQLLTILELAEIHWSSEVLI
ncbi:unnamed protein product [Auanema sp. JU1783]|nr:unnamed protein product [Auanema sp. JU1783]